MADPTLTGKFLIQLGDGGSPSETFAYPCGALARSVTLTNNTGETVVMDCTDPLATTAAIKRWTESQDTQLTISGRVATESLSAWRAWADGGAAKNIRAFIDEAGAAGGGYWALPAILQSFQISVEGKATATFEATIVAAGRRAWTAAS